MDFPIEEIIEPCKEIGVDLDSKVISRLEQYGKLLLEYNEKINLTAITDKKEVVWKHFYDCILFFKNIKVKEGAKIIDVGTGAGFPGVVLKIIRNDIDLTLLDALNKRLLFLGEVLKELDLEANLLHYRAEDGARKEELREKYDFAVARAVARQNILAEYCMPYVKKGGYFVALKGPSGREEAEESAKAIKVLGGKEIKIFREENENIGVRTILVSEKIASTDKKYPRPTAKIKKQPL